MSISMLGSNMWELYLSFESYVVWTFLLHHSSYDLYPWYGTLSEDGDRKRNGEVGTSRQRRTQRTNTTPTCGSRAY